VTMGNESLKKRFDISQKNFTRGKRKKPEILPIDESEYDFL